MGEFRFLFLRSFRRAPPVPTLVILFSNAPLNSGNAATATLAAMPIRKLFCFFILANFLNALAATPAAAQTNGTSSSAANTVGLWSNSVERLHIDSSGNVGIGMTNPGYLLDVNGTLHVSGATTLSGSVTYGSSVTATAFIPTGASVPANGMYLSAANTLAFATNSAAVLTITSTGGLNSSGTNAGYFVNDRSSSGTGGIYRTAGINRIWDNSYGDTILYNTIGQVGIDRAPSRVFDIQVGTTAGVNSARVVGYQPSFEVFNQAGTANWYLGNNDADGNKLYIGAGYGPNQGIAPAITVIQSSYWIEPDKRIRKGIPSARGGCESVECAKMLWSM